MYLLLKAVQWFTICRTSPPSGLAIGSNHFGNYSAVSEHEFPQTIDFFVSNCGNGLLMAFIIIYFFPALFKMLATLVNGGRLEA